MNNLSRNFYLEYTGQQNYGTTINFWQIFTTEKLLHILFFGKQECTSNLLNSFIRKSKFKRKQKSRKSQKN